MEGAADPACTAVLNAHHAGGVPHRRFSHHRNSRHAQVSPLSASVPINVYLLTKIVYNVMSWSFSSLGVETPYMTRLAQPLVGAYFSFLNGEVHQWCRLLGSDREAAAHVQASCLRSCIYARPGLRLKTAAPLSSYSGFELPVTKSRRSGGRFVFEQTFLRESSCVHSLPLPPL